MLRATAFAPIGFVTGSALLLVRLPPSAGQHRNDRAAWRGHPSCDIDQPSGAGLAAGHEDHPVREGWPMPSLDPSEPDRLRRLGLRFIPLTDHTFQRHSFGIEIRIDGRLLLDIVRDIEALSVTDVAGAYEPASPLGLLSELSVGEGRRAPFLLIEHPGWRIDLLICDCGIPSCWSLTAEVRMEADHVRWVNLESNLSLSQGVHYDGLGPLVFDRSQYIDEVNRLVQALAAGTGG
jgi:hypothetical protein